MQHLKISIITPCYNMEKYIQGTIESILNQNYSNLEYIIVDGGSTDGTLEIINKYKEKITKIISEPDNGMYDAINKGLKLASGDIMAYLNADDQYLPGALNLVNQLFIDFPDVDWLSGIPTYMDEQRLFTEVLPTCGSKKQEDIANGFFRQQIYGCIMQESTFWRRTLWEKAGGTLDTSLRYAGDFELWVRFARYAPLTMVDVPLSTFMRRGDALSSAGHSKYDEEVKIICSGKKKYPNLLWKMFGSNRKITGLLRLISKAKAPVIYFSHKHRKFIKSELKQGVSYHTLMSIQKRFR